jgi:hypothetical protein
MKRGWHWKVGPNWVIGLPALGGKVTTLASAACATVFVIAYALQLPDAQGWWSLSLCWLAILFFAAILSLAIASLLAMRQPSSDEPSHRLRDSTKLWLVAAGLAVVVAAWMGLCIWKVGQAVSVVPGFMVDTALSPILRLAGR